MKPRTASASVAKCGMPSSSKARFEAAVLAQPDREDGLLPKPFARSRRTVPATASRGVRRAGERRRHVQHQHGVVLRVGEEGFERGARSARRRRRR